MWPEGGRIAHAMTELKSWLRATQISMERIMLGSSQMVRSVLLLTVVVPCGFSHVLHFFPFRRGFLHEWHVSLVAVCACRSGFILNRGHLSDLQACLEGSRPWACLSLVTLVAPSPCLSTSFVSSLHLPHAPTHSPTHAPTPLCLSFPVLSVPPSLCTSPKIVAVRCAVEFHCQVSDLADTDVVAGDMKQNAKRQVCFKERDGLHETKKSASEHLQGVSVGTVVGMGRSVGVVRDKARWCVGRDRSVVLKFCAQRNFSDARVVATLARSFGPPHDPQNRSCSGLKLFCPLPVEFRLITSMHSGNSARRELPLGTD